jgi:hypothetical protein
MPDGEDGGPHVRDGGGNGAAGITIDTGMLRGWSGFLWELRRLQESREAQARRRRKRAARRLAVAQ